MERHVEFLVGSLLGSYIGWLEKNHVKYLIESHVKSVRAFKKAN